MKALRGACRPLLLTLAVSLHGGCSDYYDVDVRAAVDNQSDFPVQVTIGGSKLWTGAGTTFTVAPWTLGHGSATLSRCSGDPCDNEEGPRIRAESVRAAVSDSPARTIACASTSTRADFLFEADRCLPEGAAVE
jgi:hypothetical protein